MPFIPHLKEWAFWHYVVNRILLIAMLSTPIEVESIVLIYILVSFQTNIVLLSLLFRRQGLHHHIKGGT